MTVERAIVFGRLAGIVETRNMLVCDVVPSGGDTTQVLWDAYLNSVYDPVKTMLTTAFATSLYQLQNRSAGKWVTFDEVTFAKYGNVEGDILPNAVAMVLIGKSAGLRHVGRKFFSGIPESMATYNGLATGAIAVAAATLLAYVTPFTGLGGGTITPGILDKAEVFRPFVGGFVSSLLGSMRRRKPGVGI